MNCGIWSVNGNCLHQQQRQILDYFPLHMRNLFWATYEEAVEEQVEGDEVELLVRDAVLVVPR